MGSLLTKVVGCLAGASLLSQPFTRHLRRVALLRGKKVGEGAGKSRVDPKSLKEESEAERAKAAAALWEARLEVTEISRKEHREAARRLARNNEELERQQRRLEKDMVDVVSCLKKQDAEKEDLVGVAWPLFNLSGYGFVGKCQLLISLNCGFDFNYYCIYITPNALNIKCINIISTQCTNCEVCTNCTRVTMDNEMGGT